MTLLDALPLALLVALAVFLATRRSWDQHPRLGAWPISGRDQVDVGRPALRADRLVAGGSLSRAR